MLRRIGWIGVVLVVLLAFAVAPTQAQRREIRIPDVFGYRTLKCDFHMHTVFSDGLVWPTVRVEEAWREGLDAIAITDHIEYQPKKNDIPTHHNRPYEIAQGQAKKRGLLLVRGAEITRDTPPGHFNAIFLNDIDPLDTKNFMDVLEAARKQDAFVFWNHPGWKAKGDEKYIFAIHEKIRKAGLIQGVEICNGRGYWPVAHAWANEHHLALVGNSDIHAPADNDMVGPANHRTITLVFATEKTVDALKEAVMQGRTAVWQGNTIYGDGTYLNAIFEASIEVEQPHYRYRNMTTVTITNNSDIDFECRRTGNVGPETVTLPAGQQSRFRVPVDKDGWAYLEYTVTNLKTAPGKGISVSYSLYAQEP